MTTTTPARRPKMPRDPRLVALPETFLDCRDRHDWNGAEEAQRWRYPSKVETLEIATQCNRCGSIQVREVVTYTPRGVVEPGALYRPTWIDYADGYLLKLAEGEEKLPRAAFRLERARRFLDRSKLPIKDRAR
jgi:hypothetical protein